MPRRQTTVTGKLLNELWNVGAKHALYREDGKWYHNLSNFPGVLFDSNGYIVFQTEQDYHQNPYLKITEDLHIMGGISSIPGYVRVSESSQIRAFSQRLHEVTKRNQLPSYQYLNNELSNQELLRMADLPGEKYEVTRVLTEYQRIVRDPKISFNVKVAHSYQCQICGYAINLRHGRFYAEAHHVKPLGDGHNGPDIVENIMCVCPNHHVLLDYAAIPINSKKLITVNGHTLSKTYIEYHNEMYERERAAVMAE